ncbi:class I SAM-dependent methyltransferase [Limisalsivibrio acetivorans]|uniref:class I SAM-dependent methyltransferase n=1 Tax=Limisalsivibrio acetivorans TaxID=1304888 RepID=UPI0003B7AA8B|nr:class I SAM-dependent methyltransferase [Limisalsivibrio acetivorans]
MSDNFNEITEVPGLQASVEQLQRLYQRYRFAVENTEGPVLEAACGSGIGLGYLAEKLGRADGCDIDKENLRIASELHRDNESVEVFEFDACRLREIDKEYGLIILYEAVYYLDDIESFIYGAMEKLKKGGWLIICSVNPEWKDFHPSPYARRYYTAAELAAFAGKYFSTVETYGAFPSAPAGAKDRAFSVLKRGATKMNLIPGSLRLRTYLKRIFMGELKPIPEAVTDNMIDYEPPVPYIGGDEYKIIYMAAQKD